MAVTVGTFDGLHLGHQKIIGRMKETAHEINGETVVVTFDPHPRLVLYADSKNLKFINTRERKFKLLEEFGIDHLIIIPFTKEFAKNTPEDFIRNFLTQKINMRKLVIGYDHHFGNQREGNFERLSELGEKYGFLVEEIPALYVNGTAVSSTKIRHALMDGEVKWANELLGYKYSITGIVVEGNRIGRTIGFPTANIEIEDKYKLIAAGGVYACEVERKGEMYSGMGNIGVRPTIGINGLVTEVHIFDFDEDIYGEEIRIIFIDRIRDEVKFEGLEALKSQLSKDRENVKGLLEC
ncbi:MAG: bifunctional riboflavin kinase/FAD synthetase [Chlorobi bacterium]|nr:bifunctional riboflavin kinase/FAD synthetase [Chlorobiota bacterium]